MLRRTIERGVREGLCSQYTAQVHDMPGLLLGHVGPDFLTGDQRAPDIGVEQRPDHRIGRLNMLSSYLNSICAPLLQQPARGKTPVAERQPQADRREQQPGKEALRTGEMFVFDMLRNA